MKLIDQMVQDWAERKAHRLSTIAEDPHGEYNRLDRLHRINKADLP